MLQVQKLFDPDQCAEFMIRDRHGDSLFGRSSTKMPREPAFSVPLIAPIVSNKCHLWWLKLQVARKQLIHRYFYLQIVKVGRGGRGSNKCKAGIDTR
jgi:hypothetical protein